jgi:type III secretory pathway component EscT
LVSPDESRDFATATLVLVVLALRIGVLFVILPALAYQLTAAALVKLRISVAREKAPPNSPPV